MEVSRLRSGRLSGKKNYPTASWHRPLSARNEHQSHPPGWTSSGLRAPHQADGPRAPMAPVETTDAATVDHRCPFKHRTRRRHNHSNSKLCVALRMGQANLLSITNCHLCAGAMLSSRSIFQATRFVRVTLEQGAMSASQGKKPPDLCVSSLCKPYLCIVQKKNYPSQILNVILVQGPCSNIQSHTIFVQGPCNSVQTKKLRHPCAGAMRQCPAEDKVSGSSRSSYLRTSIRGFHRFAPREHHGRSFWRETWR